MPQLKLIATKIPEDWEARIEQLTKETGLTRAEILREAIGQYLGVEGVNRVKAVNQSEVLAKLEALENRISQLEKRDNPINAVNPPKTGTEAPTYKATRPIDASATPCPKCGSTNTAEWGKGRVRGDGSQGQKIKCGNCGKFSIVG